MPALSLQELKGPPGESSAAVAERVLGARQRQRRRFGTAASTPINAAMAPEEIRRFCTLDRDARRLLDAAFEPTKATVIFGVPEETQPST